MIDKIEFQHLQPFGTNIEFGKRPTCQSVCLDPIHHLRDETNLKRGILHLIDKRDGVQKKSTPAGCAFQRCRAQSWNVQIFAHDCTFVCSVFTFSSLQFVFHVKFHRPNACSIVASLLHSMCRVERRASQQFQHVSTCFQHVSTGWRFRVKYLRTDACSISAFFSKPAAFHFQRFDAGK